MMTANRRYQLECAAFTVAVCCGIVWLVGDRAWSKLKGALL